VIVHTFSHRISIKYRLPHRVGSILFFFLFVFAESSIAAWEPNRNAQNQVVVDGLGQPEAFDSPNSLSKAKHNHNLFYNRSLS